MLIQENLNKSRLLIQNENGNEKMPVKLKKSNFQSKAKDQGILKKSRRQNKKKPAKERKRSQVKYEYKESNFFCLF